MTVRVAAVFFLASLVRSTFGFGEALIAVPLLAFVLPVQIAAPVAVLVSITVAAIVVARDWRHVQLRSAGRLLFSTIFGIPVGLLLLRSVPDAIVKLLLGGLVAGFSLWSLARVHASELEDDRFAWAFGWLAGVLGGAYGMNGPPLAIYGALRRWPPAQFRATLQGYFLPASVFGLIGYGAAGLWTPAVTRYFLLSLPSVVLAIAISRPISRWLDGRSFLSYVHAFLVVVGTVLIVQSLGDLVIS
ncbi:MAG TPA: sulfite exporter TauE/SafE family protein [Mycobacterium sp.]|nr:sulfite exporter TauE/SafE family protein [Mycobacterium sp.]